jgi:menaquinone-specific isochorismate synthase
MSSLVASTRPASALLDLISFAGADGWVWERARAGFAGRGAALRIPVPSLGQASSIVAAALETIAVDDPRGVPVAFGALPFDRGAPAELVVPAVLYRRGADGQAWITTIGPPDSDDHDGVAEEPRDPDQFTLSSPVPHAEWMDLVAKAVAAIDRETFDKVVLAREVVATANRDIHVPTVLRRLRSLYPACVVTAVPLGSRRFVAASPELLVSRTGPAVQSHPLAGTIPRSGDPEVDDALAHSLMESGKDRAEHDWVVQDVARALSPWCSTLAVPSEPSIVSFRNVSHLGTLVSGVLAAPAPSALALAGLLHPTAAVGGTPREAALAWLAEHEHFDRGPYAGPVGWVDANGDGEWMVGIRSAVVSGREARMFAGVGVVEGSDPASELAETQFKLQALLAAVVRP